MNRGDSSPTRAQLNGAASQPRASFGQLAGPSRTLTPNPPRYADKSAPNSAVTSRNSQTGRITPPSTKCLLCGIPHNRHGFAVRTLLEWYRDGLDVQARLPLLSTYMGHVDPASTFWYLTAAPELLALVADRLDSTMEGLA
jgi:hypothetical protein